MIFFKHTHKFINPISLLSLGVLAFAIVSAEKAFAYNVSEDSRCQDDGSTAVCMIDRPPVNDWFTNIFTIQFDPGDKVTIDAGGCVQTGGSGKTWKKYVDPSGPSSSDHYHGLISLPGFTGLDRISDHLGQPITIAETPPEVGRILVLGYEDGLTDYGDNGYWDHDDGTGDQCENVGNAWVKLTIQRQLDAPDLDRNKIQNMLFPQPLQHIRQQHQHRNRKQGVEPM